jgi:orotidine-5'-phosphate decarboxylase
VNFADRLAEAVEARRSQIVLGLDPDPAALLDAGPQLAAPASPGLPASVASELAAQAVVRHCRALIQAAGPACVAVKLQLACFERLGPAGWGALFETAEAARDAHLMVVADGKRGDVPHTAAAYAEALLDGAETPWGRVAGLGADAVTANPLLGRDSLEPIVGAARSTGAGTFVLVRTSNPGAAEVQDADCGGSPLHVRLAALVSDLAEGGVGSSGLADVGAVVGATNPQLLGRLREVMPRSVFLLPGVGVQGGRVEELAAAFSPGRSAALVTASRSIVGAALEAGAAGAAREAAERLREATWALGAS